MATEGTHGEGSDWSLTGKEEPIRPDLPRVLVIGAGMAGLVAARMLHASGFAVTLLEARNRIGGRLLTDSTLGGPCDFGGSWIHNAQDNPLSRWCAARGIALIVNSEGTRHFYHRGQLMPRRQAYVRAWLGMGSAALMILWVQLRARIEKAQGNAISRSVGEAIFPLLNAPWLPTFDRQLLGWLLSMSEGVEGAPADLVRIDNWYPADTMGVNAIPSGGYARLLEDVAQGLEIHLETPIAHVQVDAQGAMLHSDCMANVYHGGIVVVATPLAVLATGKIHFEPPLPPHKQEAIQRIGYGGRGVLNKLFLRFPHRFWPAGQTTFAVLPQTPEKRGIFTSWAALDESTGVPILMGYCDGETAAALDRGENGGDDVQIVEQGMKMLRLIFGNDIPQPTACHFTRWLSDPWAMGSYSYTSIHTRPGDRDLYAAPVGDKLFFCGEATINEGYGTVHAALESGAETAQRIFERYTGLRAHTERLIFKRDL